MEVGPPDYELLNFGGGRKLERFGQLVIDRPAVVACEQSSCDADRWSAVDARYDALRASAGDWSTGRDEPWQLAAGDLRFELRLTESGQVGLFPEQAENWRWIAHCLRGGEARVLNLFAYTGASTLAAASGGASVVHVDAATSVVNWARRNAQLSQLHKAPIRWIVEDSRKFVEREVRRGNRYEAIILDPPSYGHGPSGAAWKFAADIEPLIHNCATLLSDRSRCVLLTCHTVGWGQRELAELLRHALPPGKIEAGSMDLATRSGRRLDGGVFARWVAL